MNKSNNTLTSQVFKIPKNFKYFLIIILVLSIFFRFANLDLKGYWGDETYTTLRVAGYKWSEYSEVFDGRELTIDEIQKYQRINPSKTMADTIDSLAEEDPHHPPLYYAIGRVWMQWFGHSVTANRSLPVLLSLLVFPSIYWLCLELFHSSIIGWMAIAIVAVSPFHLLYAQEVREYSLWTVTILLSSAALLKAMRVQTKLSWGVYAITVALSLYTFLFSVLVLFGQGIYVLLMEKFKRSKTLFSYLVSSFIGFILFSPWIYIVFLKINNVLGANSDKIDRVSIVYLLKTLGVNITRIFFDINFGYQDPFNLQFNFNNPFTYLMPPTLVLVGYAIYCLSKHTPKSVWLFIWILIGVPGGILVFSDLILGGSLSAYIRYFIPSILGIQLTLAYLLSQKIFIEEIQHWQKRVWRIITVLIISGSVLSCVLIFQSDTWWNKYSDYFNPLIARQINQYERPLLIINNPWRALPISYSLDPKVKIKIALKPEDIDLKTYQNFSNVFIFNSYNNRGEQLKQKIKENWDLDLNLIYQNQLTFKNRIINLWKIDLDRVDKK